MTTSKAKDVGHFLVQNQNLDLGAGPSKNVIKHDSTVVERNLMLSFHVANTFWSRLLLI